MKIGNCGESSAEQERRLRKRLWCARTIEDPEQKLLTRPASLEMYRKREGARHAQEHGVFARFRYKAFQPKNALPWR
jgi:hypothetical protein